MWKGSCRHRHRAFDSASHLREGNVEQGFVSVALRVKGGYQERTDVRSLCFLSRVFCQALCVIADISTLTFRHSHANRLTRPHRYSLAMRLGTLGTL